MPVGWGLGALGPSSPVWVTRATVFKHLLAAEAVCLRLSNTVPPPPPPKTQPHPTKHVLPLPHGQGVSLSKKIHREQLLKAWPV